MAQPLKNKMGLNRSFGSSIPTEADDNVPDAAAGLKGGKSRTIGPIKGRVFFSKSPIGAEKTKQSPLGLDRNFGNALPEEDARDPYRVNKNAREGK